MAPSPLEANAAKEPAPAVSDVELNAYIDGELSGDQRHMIEQLIAQDAGVRTRIEGLLNVRELVRQAYSTNHHKQKE